MCGHTVAKEGHFHCWGHPTSHFKVAQRSKISDIRRLSPQHIDDIAALTREVHFLLRFDGGSVAGNESWFLFFIAPTIFSVSAPCFPLHTVVHLLDSNNQEGFLLYGYNSIVG